MIVIEKNNKTSDIIGNVLLASNIEVIGWDSSLIPLYKMLEDKSPDLLIYGQEANMNGIEYIKQRFPNTILAYLGDNPSDDIPADLIIGESSNRASVRLPTNLYDITNLPSGAKNLSMICKMCCFTDSMNQDKVSSISDIVIDLCRRDVRFFGNTRLDCHQYLGIVNEQQKSDIIKSTDIYIDLSGDYWHKPVILGTIPIVLSSNFIPGVNTFTDVDTLGKSIEDTLQGSYDLPLAREEVVRNTGFDFCASILSTLGAQEASDSVLQFKETFI
tara:strand:- start:151 stop:969 length:819 start_codon:yes stop_codon:yes gene_type:complete